MNADIERLAKTWALAHAKALAGDLDRLGCDLNAYVEQCTEYFEPHVRAILTELRALAFDDEQTRFDGLAVSVAIDKILEAA